MILIMTCTCTRAVTNSNERMRMCAHTTSAISIGNYYEIPIVFLYFSVLHHTICRSAAAGWHSGQTFSHKQQACCYNTNVNKSKVKQKKRGYISSRGHTQSVRCTSTCVITCPWRVRRIEAEGYRLRPTRSPGITQEQVTLRSPTHARLQHHGAWGWRKRGGGASIVRVHVQSMWRMCVNLIIWMAPANLLRPP